ncbi:MAG: ATP-grasp domain-containing protein [Planctomycetaceae bacterium]|nr:ATP-grasp domain-containing protein [Planctomycetaceae bacterium]
MARVLLMLPTRTYRTPALLAAAARSGVELTVACEETSSLAHLNPTGLLTLPFSSPEQVAEPVLAFHRDHPIDAVIGVDDTVVEAVAVAARVLGLPHNDPQSVALARDKRLSREAFAAADVRSPEFSWRSFDDSDRAARPGFGFPAIVKPLQLSAGRGVIRADSPGELAAAIERLESILESEPDCTTETGFLVESFVPGPEVALEGLLRGSELEVLAIFDKPEPLEGPYFEETIYLTPSRQDEDWQQLLAETAAEACRAVRLEEGSVHVEMRVTPEGPVVIEVNPRAIGGLCSEVLRFGTGLSLEDLLLNHALGDRAPLPPRADTAAGVMMLPVPAAGRLVRVDGLQAAGEVPGIQRVAITAHPGQLLQPWPEGSPYPGFLFARGKTCEDVQRALHEAHGKLTLVLDESPRCSRTGEGDARH